MSFIKFKRASWIAVMAMLALPGAMMMSCSKEMDPTEVTNPKGDKLVISVVGINDGNNDHGSKAKASTVKSSLAGALNNHQVYEFSDVDMAVSVGNTLPAKKLSKNIGGRSNSMLSSAGLKAAEEMRDGIKYVVYIFDDNDTFVQSAELAAGTPGTIDDLDMSSSYTWVALSYNNDEQAPTLTPASGSIDDLPENTDVLYAKGTVDLATDPTIAIVFDHAFARIGVELNTIGAFGEMTGATSVTVTGASLATGDINLLTGEVAPGDTYEPSLTFESFENIDPNYDDAKIAYLYTAANDNQDLIVSVQGLQIRHVDDVDGPVSRTYFADGSNFETTITPESGNSHHILLNVVESALTNEGVQWGRSNLYYRGDNGGGRDYAFYATNQATSRADGYFSYGGIMPLQFPTDETSGDPCALVYPAGIWKQPTDVQVNTLTSSQGLLTDVLGLIGGLLGAADPAPKSTVGDGYVQYAINAGGGSSAFEEASNNLRFYYNGQITHASLLSAIGTDGDGLLGLGLNSLSVDLAGNTLLDLGLEVGPGLPLPVLQLPILGDSYGEQAAFWSGTGALNIPILASVGSWGYAAFTTRRSVAGIPVGSEFVKATTTAELLSNVDLLGVDLLNTSLKNVRCVRAN